MAKKMKNIKISMMIKLILQHVLLPIRDNYLKGETEVQWCKLCCGKQKRIKSYFGLAWVSFRVMGKEMKISTQKKARFLIKKIRLILISANKKIEKGKIKLKQKKD